MIEELPVFFKVRNVKTGSINGFVAHVLAFEVFSFIQGSIADFLFSWGIDGFLKIGHVL
jgi:hypothetical protein